MYWTGSLPEIILVFPMIPSGVSRCVCVLEEAMFC